MIDKLSPDDFIARSRQGVVIDVRTPAEFASGHIPGAYNMPLFSDAERAEVGTLYVRTGRDQAVERGLELVGPRLAHIVSQARTISGQSKTFLYCWRGGMRSGSVAWLLQTAGMKVALLEGGYKAYRRGFEALLTRHNWRFILLSGRTGSGKSELLEHIGGQGAQVLDLEGIAHHKGSVFGGLGQQPQPTTEHFINLLHARMREFDPALPVWCEGESMLVGHVFIPQPLFGMMHSGTVVNITMDRAGRLARLINEYGSFPAADLAEKFMKISKRMGRDRAQAAIEALQKGDVATAAGMALEYYDKAYACNSSPQSVEFHTHSDTMQADARRLIELVTELWTQTPK